MTLRRGQSVLVYKPITAATKAAPCVLTAPSHGVYDQWPITLASVKGMTELNGITVPATVIDADTIELNSINALDYASYTSGGTIIYNAPVDLTGYTARAQIRETAESTIPIISLTSGVDGGITIDPATASIELVIDAVTTASYATEEAVWDLELVNGSEVERIAYGSVTLSTEVTR